MFVSMAFGSWVAQVLILTLFGVDRTALAFTVFLTAGAFYELARSRR